MIDNSAKLNFHWGVIADYAKRLKEAEVNQTLVHEQMTIREIEKIAEARVMDEETKYQDKKLQSTVQIQAETDKYKLEVAAEAEKKKVILKNEAVGYRIEALGNAEAEVIKMKAEAEARAMKMKADAYAEVW